MVPKEILQSVRRIEIKTKSIIDSIMGGEYRTVFKGNGMEFSEVRPYFEGDDVRSIDWNVTARTGEPFIKKNIEERELTVLLAIDISGSAEFGTHTQTKSQMIAELGALLAFSAIRNNDQVGLLLFTDTVEKFIPPRKGRKHVLHLIRELLYFKPKSRGTNIAAALSHLNQIQKKKSVVFLVSDFRDSSFLTPISVTAKRHDLIAISAEDPREMELPNIGLVDFLDPETGETMLVDTGSSSFRSYFKRQEISRKNELAEILKKHKVDHLSVNTETGFVEPLIKFFHKREARR